MDGILSYNLSVKRYEIIFNDGSRIELHCGDCFKTLIDTEWISTRIEYDWDKQKWYLYDASLTELNGLKVIYNKKGRF